MSGSILSHGVLRPGAALGLLLASGGGHAWAQMRTVSLSVSPLRSAAPAASGAPQTRLAPGQEALTGVLESAGIRVGGSERHDLLVKDPAFYSRVLADPTL